MLCSLVAVATGAAASDSVRGVIHVISDDLRPAIGAYGDATAVTPNMDSLAARGTCFDRAYAQQAVCGPSRNSFMTGRRPDRSRVWNFIDDFRLENPNWTTLPGLFLTNRTLALGSGKSFHPKQPPQYDGDKSWSAESLPYMNPCWNTADLKSIPDKYQDGGLPCIPCVQDIRHYLYKAPLNVLTENCQIDAFEDTYSVNHGITLLRKAVTAKKPFYLAVGFHKPHLPWQAADEDWAAHPLSKYSGAAHPVPPKDMPPLAFHFTDEDNVSHIDPWHPFPGSDARYARRAYAAALTGMDRKLGVLLEEMRTLGIENSTAILLHGDHGWHLGELGVWRKMTNFEHGVRVPLIISVPWLDVRRRSAAPVELVDVLPTIADIMDIPLPKDEVFDGKSLLPFVRNDTTPAPADPNAYSQYPRRVTKPDTPWKSNSIIHHPRDSFTHMGYTVRTTEWRYTEWRLWNGSALEARWDSAGFHASELYDHRGEAPYPTNFDSASETVNVVSNSSYADVVKHLSDCIMKRFKLGLPC